MALLPLLHVADLDTKPAECCSAMKVYIFQEETK